ncbi:unnamed protein product [Rhizophagus irregularis]|nr:unnamed protein product [Rhizophagus irregularis]
MFARYRIRNFLGWSVLLVSKRLTGPVLVVESFCTNSLPRRTTLLGFSTELALADDCLISLISSSILAISILGLKLNNAIQNRKNMHDPLP